MGVGTVYYYGSICIVDFNIFLLDSDNKVKYLPINDKVKYLPINDKVKYLPINDKVKCLPINDKAEFPNPIRTYLAYRGKYLFLLIFIF